MNAEAVLDDGVYDDTGFHCHSIIHRQQFGRAIVPLQPAAKIDTSCKTIR